MASPQKLGLRERGKLEKRARIAKAAREIFAERGYEAATTREIADRAEVSVATLFVYAKDKTQLLKAIYEWQLEKITEEAHASIDVRAPLTDQLIAFFRPRYHLWERDPRLARTAMRIAFDEIMEPASGTKHSVSAVWSKIHQNIADLIEQYKRYSGRCADADSSLITRGVFAIYMTHVQLWIAEPKPNAEDGVASLRPLLDLICAPLESRIVL